MRINRLNDSLYLSRFYESHGNHALVFYGMKSVGKTQLLKEFSLDKPHIFISCEKISAKRQLKEIAEVFSSFGCAKENFNNLSDMLLSASTMSEGKLLLVVDEFQNLFKDDASLFFELFDFVKHKEHDSEIMLVLLSSSMDFVENSLVDKLGKTAFQIDGFYKMRPFTYREMINDLKLPNSYRYDIMTAYCILGGVAGRYKLWDFSKSIRENIILLLKENRFWLPATEVILEELREPMVYQTILYALAEGKNKLNDIYEDTGYSRAKISVYLKNLMDIGLVEKPYSFEVEGNRNGQKGVYRISDSYISFCYRFIMPHISMLYEISAEEFYERYIEKALDTFIGDRESEVFRDFLWEIIGEGHFSHEYINHGEWIGKMGIIDFVATDAENNTILGFTKWGSKVTKEDMEWFMFCAEKAGRKADETVIFCMHGFEPEVLSSAEESTYFLRDLKV